jgi:glyoxylase-like metal-dependent hydrolase (beta-lactamase superfamily II)
MTKAPVLAWERGDIAGVDTGLADGDVVPFGERLVQVLHTPGHRFDHLCFQLPDAQVLFAGDLVAGVGTVVIAPPEGDLADYLQSLERLLALPLRQLLPAHGPPVDEPHALLQAYIDHRLEREAQVLAALDDGIGLIEAMVARIYADVDLALHPLAAQTLQAHLLKLEREGQVMRIAGEPGQEGWRRRNPKGQ